MATIAKMVLDIEANTSTLVRDVDNVRRTMDRLERSTSGINTKMVAFGSAIGSAVGILAVSAIKKLGSEVVELATNGIKLAPVVTSFERLTASIGESSNAMLTTTRTSTKGLITDLDIMAASNKAILLGLPVTSAEMGVLGQAAVSLGRAMKQDAGKSLDDLIIALGRSSPLILDNLGLTVKVGEANEKYARQVGKSASALTDAEKKLAFYNAAMDAAKAKTETLGGIQLKLADQLVRLRVQFTNFTDALGVAIARSPVLAAALGGVADSIEAAFGGNQVTRIQTLAGMVNTFAIRVVDAAQMGVTGLGYLVQAWEGLKMIILATISIVYLVNKGFVELVAVSAELAAKIPGVGSAFAGVAAKARSAADHIGGMQRSLHEQADAALQGALGNSAFQRTLDGVSGTLGTMRQRMVEASHTQVTSADIAADLTKTMDALGGETAATGKDAKKAAEDWAKWSESVREASFMTRKFLSEHILLAPAIEDNQASLGAYNIIANHSVDVAGQHAQAVREQEAELRRLGLAFDFTAHTANNASEQIKQSIGIFDGMKTSLRGLWEGLSGGGGIKGLFSNLGKGLMDGFGNLLSGGISGLISTGIGAAVSGLKKLFGIGKSQDRILGEQATAQIKDLQRDLIATYGSLDNIRKIGGAAGDALAAAWGSQNRAGLEHFKKLIDEFNETIALSESFLKDQFPAALRKVADSGALVSDEFRGIIHRLEEMGLASEEITGFMRGQLTSAVSGIHALVSNSSITSQATADGLMLALTASFDEMIRRGMTAREALAAISPAMQSLSDQMKANGLAGSAAFSQVQAMAAIAKDEIAGPALDAISGATQAMTGLHNAGLLNQESFIALSNQATQAFGTIVDQGYSADQAMRLIAPDMQRIWELQQDFGFQVDDSTQLLLDQASQAGLVGDAHRDAQQVAVKAMQDAALAMERVADVLERVFGTAGDQAENFADRAAVAIDGLPDEVVFTVRGVYIPPDMPGSGGPVDMSLEGFLSRNPGDEHRFEDATMHAGGIVDFASGVQRAHDGMVLAHDEVPIIIAQTGEGILSRRGMAAFDAMNSGRVPSAGMSGVEKRLDRLTAENAAQNEALRKDLRRSDQKWGYLFTQMARARV